MANITTELVRQLLARPESATLDFKRHIYRIHDRHHEAFQLHRDELIKDILALANNNATYAGDNAYLVIGASDELTDEGNRLLFDVGHDFVDHEIIQKYVNAACDPAIQAIESSLVTIDGTELIVICIPPSQFVHETTRRLMPVSAKHGYAEHTVFIRHGSHIQVAAWQESDAIAKVKRLRHEERRNPPATPFGAIVGAIIGGSILAPLGKKLTDGAPGSEVAGGMVGTGLGGLLGAAIGHNYGNVIHIRSEWPTMSRTMRVLVFVIPSVTTLAFHWIVLRFRQNRSKFHG